MIPTKEELIIKATHTSAQAPESTDPELTAFILFLKDKYDKNMLLKQYDKKLLDASILGYLFRESDFFSHEKTS